MVPLRLRAMARPFTVIAAAALLAACSTPGSGGSSSEATTAAGGDCDGYPSGDIELVVPYSPGGGFDTWARLIAPYLAENLPNNPNVVVVNREGAGGLVGVTEVLGAEPDGSTIAITEPGILATSQIAGTTDADFTGLRALGRLTVTPEVIVVAADSEFDSIEDVQAAAESGPVLMGTGGLAAVNIVSFDALGIPFDNVVHEGSSEALLSVIRGDTQITVFPITSVREGIAGGDLKPLVVVGDRPSEGQPGAEEVADVPTLDEATGVDGLGGSLVQSRILVAPPETPDCVVDTLDAAIAASFEDQEFLDQVAAADYVADHATADETQEVVSGTYSALQEYADLLREQLES